MKKIDEILELLDDIRFESYSEEPSYSKFQKLKMKTKKIWDDNHTELIKELALGSKIIKDDVDYQIFWYECLGFPPIRPLFRDNIGNTLGYYGSLPSDFNEICGFHDSFIERISIANDNKITVDIELDSWESASYAKLTFQQVYRYIIRKIDNQSNLVETIGMEDLECNNIQILEVNEVPPINHILREHQIVYDPVLVQNRMFTIYGTYGVKTDLEIIIFCEKWGLDLIK